MMALETTVMRIVDIIIMLCLGVFDGAALEMGRKLESQMVNTGWEIQ
jgi:hypothetical protein